MHALIRQFVPTLLMLTAFGQGPKHRPIRRCA